MKRISLIVGIILSIYALVRGRKYLLDYSILAEYGKGYVWGLGIILLLGIVLIYLGVRKRKKE